MEWLRRVVSEILVRGDDPVVLSTGKTPSGPIHIGSERELFMCDSMRRLLEEKGKRVRFLFIVDSFDPFKSVPAGLQVPESFKEHIGKPLCDVPDPFGECHNSYAEHFAEEFLEVQDKLGVSPEVIYAHQLYTREEMKNAIRTVLCKLELLQEIRSRYVFSPEEGSQEWVPVMVVCERCGMLAPKIAGEVHPNRISSFNLDEDLVEYRCNACGYEGSIEISRGRIKLSWRVDWAAKWSIFKVTCEPAGKDHCVKGGAYDMGLEVSQRIFGYRGPIKVPYEWLTLEGKAMKTHKGITFTPAEWLSVAPPEVMRYMILSVDPMRHISFSPLKIPDLVDSFDRLERIYFDAEAPSEAEDPEELKLLYEMCLVDGVPDSLPARLPYRFAVFYVQLIPLLGYERVLERSITMAAKTYRRSSLSREEISNVMLRLTMAMNWVEKYAPERWKFTITEELLPEAASKLTDSQRNFLSRLATSFESKEWDEQELQNYVFTLARDMGLTPQEAFKAVYLALLGREYGPRLAPLLLALEKKWVVERLMKASSLTA